MLKTDDMKIYILKTAWDLFLEQGYNNTTVDTILQKCDVSRGSFYHYFESKTDLVMYIAILLDDVYVKIEKTLDTTLSAKEQLFLYTKDLFEYIEDNIPKEILSTTLASQIQSPTARFLTDEDRYYFKVLRRLLNKGRDNGEFSKDITTREYIKIYAMQERAILYDWCLCDGQYPLSTYGIDMFKKTVETFLR